MHVPLWVWAATFAVLAAVVATDLTFTVRRPRRPSLREAALWTLGVIALAAAFGGVLAATADVSDHVFNAGTGVETSLRQMCRLLCEAAGQPGLEPVFEPPRKVNPVSRRRAGVERAARELGFRSRIPLSNGLNRLVEWHRRTVAVAV